MDLSRVRQAKLSRAEEWSDKWRTKEEVRGRLAGEEEKMRKETRGGGKGGDSQSPLGLMQLRFEALNLYGKNTAASRSHTHTHTDRVVFALRLKLKFI